MGGSRDLNLHKSWNPKLVRNRKKIEKTEQLLLERQKKLLKESKEKQIEDHASIDKGNLSWMYQEPKQKEDPMIKTQPIQQPLGRNATTPKVQKPQKKKNKFDYSKDDPMNSLKRK
ncbi:CWC25 (YNL245C) [Zygosaccharomyces parabailii]|nr:CWC25 (YNL245C) [Zygosaccharomyces parabailii]CDH09735.1 uncharacterized protein ZBAI_01519 [Zygosaccharomyces bailii ISA1307]